MEDGNKKSPKGRNEPPGASWGHLVEPLFHGFLLKVWD